MEDMFGGTDCRSNCETILMEVLRSAMDTAHKKVQPKDGPIEFLNKMSLFYNLAVILVEGGLKIVQEETEIPEKDVLSGIMETRKWLYERVETTQMLITDKDKELMDRIENEMKLRQVLEMKEKELALLREEMNLGRTKGGDDYDDLEEGEIAELKCPVKQNLEDADELYYKGHIFSGFKPITDTLRPERNQMIEQMTSDLDVLKHTLDFVFGTLHTAKVSAQEKKWMYTIETEVIRVLINGFIDDIQQKANTKLREKNGNTTQSSFSDEKWYELIAQMTMLLEKLDAFSSRYSFETTSASNNISRSFSDPLPEVALYHCCEDKRIHQSRYVAKMVKSHEAIIRKQHKDLSEKSMGKESSLLETNTKSDCLGRRIQECISKLDNLISWNNANRGEYEAEILEYILREDIHNVLISEMINSLKQLKDAYEIENLIKEDIHDLVISEAMKDAISLSGQDHISASSEDIPCSARKLDSEGEESLIQVLDSVLKCLEREEDLVLSASSEIEQHSVRHYLEIFRTEEQDEREAIQWLLDADESILSSVNMKLTKALKQLLTSRELLMDLEQGLGLYSDDCNENNNNATDEENTQSSCQLLDCDNRSDNAFSSLRRFQQVLSNFEDKVLNSLEMKRLRIDELKKQLHELVHPVASLKKRKQLYKKAFVVRCRSLRLAETEVDLLGDQVDALVQFLEKTYLILSKNSSALSCHFEVSDIVRSIKKELDAVAYTTRTSA